MLTLEVKVDNGEEKEGKMEFKTNKEGRAQESVSYGGSCDRVEENARIVSRSADKKNTAEFSGWSWRTEGPVVPKTIRGPCR